MKILVGLSGGLDSTYAAHLLKEAGHTVIGASVVMHPYTDRKSARESAAAVGIPLIEEDVSPLFDREVVLPFCEDYREARTPNPCILCNEKVKFATLYRLMKENGCDKMATGHYAAVVKNEDGRLALSLAADLKKDQSYVLYRLPQAYLDALLLPLSGLEKEEIREKARALGYAAADREESMEICFLPDGDYASYIADRFGQMPAGDFVDGDGRVLGRHKGILHYTVGQRKGLGISLGERMFVSAVDRKTSRITLQKDGERAIGGVRVDSLVFSGIAPQTEGKRELDAVLRYHALPQKASVTFFPDYAEVRFPSPLRSATPGQSCVCYAGGAVAFGGIIREIL